MHLSLRSIPVLLLVCGAALLQALPGAAQVPSGQKITIRMIDAKTGKPFANKNVFVTFWWDDDSRPVGERRVRVGFPNDSGGTDIPLDSHGVGRIEVPPQATLIEVQGVENVQIYGKRGRYNFCQFNGKQFVAPDERLAGGHHLVPLTLVRKEGFVPETVCQPDAPPRAMPGEYVVLAVPDHCWPLCGIVF